MDVLGRVCRQLILLAETYGQRDPAGILIPIALTQEDIAHLVAATRVSVNQAIGRLKADCLIDVDRQHHFVIRDLGGLSAHA
jgi:CRP/FNR family transcriptional regulator